MPHTFSLTYLKQDTRTVLCGKACGCDAPSCPIPPPPKRGCPHSFTQQMNHRVGKVPQAQDEGGEQKSGRKHERSMGKEWGQVEELGRWAANSTPPFLRGGMT